MRLAPIFYLSQSIISLAVLAFGAETLVARPDTIGVYDEQDNEPNAVESAITNLEGGYDEFIKRVSRAYEEDLGGVIDEGVAYTARGLSITGTAFSSGYGTSGYYDAEKPANTLGSHITFDDGRYDWRYQTGVEAKATPISSGGGDGFVLSVGQDSQKGEIMLSLYAEERPLVDLVDTLGFTFLGATDGRVTARLFFTDGSVFEQTFKVSGEDVFFGGVAPASHGIRSFSVEEESGKEIHLDDIAFTTIPGATPVPEPSALGLVLAGWLGWFGPRRCRRR